MSTRSSHSSSRGDRLLTEILKGGEKADKLANDLLTEIFHGYPVSGLSKLLAYPNDQVVEVATWIASELGEAAHPLIGEVGRLLTHSNSKVRFFAIDMIQTCSDKVTPNDAATAVQLAGDTNGAVRWKALVFLAQSPLPLLRSAKSHLEHVGGDRRHIEGLRLLISESTEDLIREFLNSPDGLLRAYGAAAAARIASRNISLLNEAASSEDLTLRRFAADMLARIEGRS